MICTVEINKIFLNVSFKHETTQHETGNFWRERMNAWRSTVNQQMSNWMLQLHQLGF